jgi:hypothetical protein
MPGYCCRQCDKDAHPNANKITRLFVRLNYVCTTCGDRECPHAEDHRQACERPWMAKAS